MKSKARVGNHPLHPMLIVIPAGSFIGALVFDIVYMLGGGRAWWDATGPTIAVGVAGALIAAVPGLVDLVKVVPRQGATRVGVTHMVLNLIIVGLFFWNAWIRWTTDVPPAQHQAYFGFWLSLVGVILLAPSGWLGWKMVYEYHCAVLEHPEALDPEPTRTPLPPRR
jgi:uncharacterized membrane protein